MMVRMRPWGARFTEAIYPGSLVEESIEMFCAQTSSGAESLTPSSLFYFQGLNFRLFAFPEKSFPILWEIFDPNYPITVSSPATISGDIRTDLHCVVSLSPVNINPPENNSEKRCNLLFRIIDLWLWLCPCNGNWREFILLDFNEINLIFSVRSAPPSRARREESKHCIPGSRAESDWIAVLSLAILGYYGSRLHI